MGLLTKDGPPDWHPASEKMLKNVNDLNIYLDNNSENIEDISMRYSLANKDVLTTITGAKNINEIDQNIKSISKPLSDKILTEFEEFFLIKSSTSVILKITKFLKRSIN